MIMRRLYILFANNHGFDLDEYIDALNPYVWIDPSDYLGIFADNSKNISFVERTSKVYGNAVVSEQPTYSYSLGANGSPCFRFGIGGITYYTLDASVPDLLANFTVFVVRNIVNPQDRVVSYFTGTIDTGLFANAPVLNKTYGSFTKIMGTDYFRTENIPSLSVDTSHKVYTHTNNRLFKNSDEAAYFNTDNLPSVQIRHLGSREPGLPIIRFEGEISYYLVFDYPLTDEQITVIQNGLKSKFNT